MGTRNALLCAIVLEGLIYNSGSNHNKPCPDTDAGIEVPNHCLNYGFLKYFKLALQNQVRRYDIPILSPVFVKRCQEPLFRGRDF